MLDGIDKMWYDYTRADRNGLFYVAIFFVKKARLGILRDWKEEVEKTYVRYY